MRFSRDQPAIILKAILTGRTGEAEVEMVLDTGSTYTLIARDLAEELGYDPATSQERVNLVTASAVERAPLITLEAIEVLGVRVADVKVACHDLPPDTRIAGLLGLSFLKETNLRISFKEDILELDDP